ncbi:MAG: hypothetical protein AAF840_17945 [Bacteroidota bacterium]
MILTASLVLSADDHNHFFVTPTGEGEGTSWEDAFGDLQAALAIAEAGDLIWVAEGTYYPTTEADRAAKFIVPNGVRVIGGFIGTEESADEREGKASKTILSGQIGEDTEEDNSYTIMYFQGVDATTVVDGFTFVGAYANGMEEGADLTTCGGAIFNNAEGTESSPQITNCTFYENFAREGGAFYNYAGEEGIASPSISGCKFLYNRSDFNGGAVYNNGDFGTSNPTYTDCHFEGNESMYGAGIVNSGLYGECKPTLTGCAFTDNFSVVRGGAIYNRREGGRGVCEATIDYATCTFDDNGSTIMNGDVDGTSKIAGQNKEAGSTIQLRRPATTTTEEVAY